MGLTPRMIIASSLLALIVGAVFALLLVTIGDLRESARRATDTRAELAAADRLEKLVIDLETGARGFVITRHERFLEPWRTARAAFPGQARTLANLVDSPEQVERARRIASAVRS
jgi:CHASE3 domain sensor protein